MRRFTARLYFNLFGYTIFRELTVRFGNVTPGYTVTVDESEPCLNVVASPVHADED
ncbi:hypothetical protein [Paraburkholderia sp. RL17-337-BIB-A]|uniref:hypothetical protein n=1 Tax=Paraburkholderia sp. RL17-337-BIB-A TaxID=3031636 RepID=UPI0038BB4DFB